MVVVRLGSKIERFITNKLDIPSFGFITGKINIRSSFCFQLCASLLVRILVDFLSEIKIEGF